MGKHAERCCENVERTSRAVRVKHAHIINFLHLTLHRSYQYREPVPWTQPPPPSSFQTAPFAQSVFQRTAPSTAYPTPPPAPISTSSSSLAHALGSPPAPPQHQPPPMKVYQPQESPAFYDHFLERKVAQMNEFQPPVAHQEHARTNPPQPPVARRESPQKQPLHAPTRRQDAPPMPQVPVRFHEPRRPITPPQKPKLQVADESPDPLALRSGSSTNTLSVTPQKRKPVVLIESPSSKRIQSFKPLSNSSLAQWNGSKTPGTSVPLTPSTTSSSFSKMSAASLNIVTPTTTKRIVNMAYVSVPPSPWLTPSSSRKGSTHMNSANGKINNLNDTPDDLGGYGSEEDGPSSPTKRRGIMDSVKSSARRTGDRDERGRKYPDI